MSSSNIPVSLRGHQVTLYQLSSQLHSQVRRPVRTTRAAAKNAENATARATRLTTRSKTVPATATIAGREPVFTRPPSAAAKGKSAATDEPAPPTAAKTRRGALLEVTRLVTNNDTKGKASSTLKGKEKEISTVPEKSKPVLVNVRKPLQETAATRLATRRVTRSTTLPTSTNKSQPTKQVEKRVAPKAPVIREEPEPVTEKTQEKPQATLNVSSSSLRKRPSNLAEQTEEPQRVSKRLHTETKDSARLRDNSREEADGIAAALLQQDREPEPATSSKRWTDLDADDWEDPAMAREYITEICEYWKRVEVRFARLGWNFR